MLASGAAISLAAPDKRISQIPDAFTDDHNGLMDLPDDFVAAAFSLEKSLYLQFRIFLNQQVSAFAGLPTNRVNPGGRLPAETYFCDACWYEVMPCMLSSMRQEERYPLHAITDEIDYFISDCWTSQGYGIKAFRRAEERVVSHQTIAQEFPKR